MLLRARGADINNDIVEIVKFPKRKKNQNNIQQTTRVVHSPTGTYYYSATKKQVHKLHGNAGGKIFFGSFLRLTNDLLNHAQHHEPMTKIHGNR